MSSLSIVIPALNEAAEIPFLARHLHAVAPGIEVVLVDGGSDDGTADAGHEAGFVVVEAERGRAAQMNAGAAAATGDQLLFLHADTRLPVGLAGAVARALNDPGVALGAFRFQLDERGPGLRVIEIGVRLRCRLLSLPLGDQGLFCRRATFEALGGFALYPFLEDMDFATRARALGSVRVLDEPAVTSARLYRERGLLRVTAWNWVVTQGFLWGWRPKPDSVRPGVR